MRLLRRLPRFQRAYAQMPTLEVRERWSRAEIEAFQLERLNDLWRHAWRHVAYYHKLRRRARLPDRFRSVAEYQAALPVLDRATVARCWQDLRSPLFRDGAWHATSGSTSAPVRVYRRREAHREMLRAYYRFRAMWGMDLFDRVAWIWGDRTAPALSSRLRRAGQWCHDRLRNRIRLPAGPLDEEDVRRRLRAIESFRPRGVHGFSRAVRGLAVGAAESGFACEGLQLISLTAEPAPTSCLAAVRQAFGVPVIREYGASECGFLAGDWPDGTLRVREDIALLETPPRPDGLFDVLVTVLTNPAFPLLRYRIGDVAEAPLTRPERGFAILGAVVGRDDELVRTWSGRSIHPSCIDELLERQYGSLIRRCQIRQSATGAVTAIAELARPATPQEVSHIAEALGQLVEVPLVKFEIVERVPQTAPGKHRSIISEFAPCEVGGPARVS